ncbi:PREDICTED: uncharacterized protein LOC105555864 [Vollenhovia emeryi]|uniref:uncharacterized protein LOC105555864 n=1 Tax=Vollenhovia emeryi TaxID=411798 RepID=UPI0005F5080F|nr:PREDICTED: uncharacterized protein LOC105555864 [Vollenhovia emeryi]
MAERFYAVVEFEDGLQIIPTNWLNISAMKAVWPNFTNNKRYYQAVKAMEESKSTWLQHTVLKIYATSPSYEVARKKLKDAEDLSDLKSGTEKEHYRKRTRKIRAAKPIHDSCSSVELSDDSFLSDIPNVPDVLKKKHSSISVHTAKKPKTSTDVQKELLERKGNERHVILEPAYNYGSNSQGIYPFVYVHVRAYMYPCV